MNNNEILKIYGTAFTEMTKTLLTRSDLTGELKHKAALLKLSDPKQIRIGIKPNLVSASTADYGATTHPEIVAGIIEYLKEHGFNNITILEGSWVGDRTSECIQVCGYDRLCETYDVPFVDLQKDAYHKTDCKGLELLICDTYEALDFLINVPVLKGHCQTKITCALKNMKGMIPNKEKRHFHSMGLHKPIAHLNTGIHQDFIVVDHICGDLDFEDGGNPVIRNCIMTAKDPVLVDSYVCHLLHYDTKQVPYVEMAAALGVGEKDLSKASICDCTEGANGFRDTELPHAKKVVEVADAVQEVESCSACYGYLIPALDMLKQEGLLEKLQEKICIGQGFQGKTGKLGVGRCTKDFEFCIMGCPPVETKIYEELKKFILEQ